MVENSRVVLEMDFGVFSVRLSDYLSENLIILNLQAKDKMDAFRTMVSSLAASKKVADPATFLAEVMAREAIEPTSIGRGVALPHTRTRSVHQPVIVFARAPEGIPFTANHTDQVQLIFMMGTPKDEANLYLQILARLCRLLRRNEFRDRLLTASTPKEILQLFSDFDSHLN